MSDTIFVGRLAELERLHGFLDKALSGSAQVCFVTGEAGVGKTSLVREFVRQARERHANVAAATGNCDSHTGEGDPYLPFMEILSKLIEEGASGEDSAPENGTSRVKTFAGVAAKTLVKFAPDLIGSLIPGSSLIAKMGMAMAKESGLLSKLETPAKEELSADLDSKKILQQYTDLLLALSAEHPLILVIDDLQWADSASVNLLFHLGVKLKEAKVLIVGTYRPNDVALGQGEDRHPMVPVLNDLKRYHGDIVIDMEAIENEHRMDLVSMLLDVEPNQLGADFRERIFRHTNGHPLFVLELLQSFKENGNLVRDADGRWVQDGAVDWSVLPARVEGVIEERIGRLEEQTREILGVASIEGEYFTVQVVSQLQKMGERELLKCLSQVLEKQHRLVREGKTEKMGKNWLSQFRFSNRLFQQYLYNELSGREKMILHEEAAALLEELYREHREKILLQLARHYEIAGDEEEAVNCYLQAGARATRIGAYEEARKQFLKALALNESLPAGDQRFRAELELQTALSTVYRATLGWDSPEVKTACYRARELCNQLNLPARLAPVVFGLWASHLMQLELREALQMAEEYLALSEKQGGNGMMLHARVAMGNTHYWMGKIQEAMDSMDAASRLCDDNQDYIAEFGQDPRILVLMFQGFSAWLLGNGDQARAYEKLMLSLAESLSHHFSMAIALYGAVTMDYHHRDIAAMKPRVEKLLEVTREHHFPLYLGLGMVYGGWIKAMEGMPEEGIAELEEGFEQWICKHGGKVTHSLYCVMMAQALQSAGQREKALSVVEKGLAVARQCSEHCYEPELHRLKGELLCDIPEGGEIPDGKHGEAEAAFEQSLQTSRAQGEKILELRGAVSLARFRRKAGKHAEALALLNGVYREFSEGLDMPDLQEAKALIDELGAPGAQPGVND